MEMWEVNDQEFSSVIALPASKLYTYFIKRAVDSERVWCLRDEEGWVSTHDNDGNLLLPLWPHPRFCAACAAGEWSDTWPEPIALDEFIDDWIPDLTQSRRGVAVFPVPTDKGLAVTPERLVKDLRDYEAEWYS